MAKLFFFTMLGLIIKTAFSQTSNLDSLLKVLSKKDPGTYSILKDLQNKKNSESIYALTENFLASLRKAEQKPKIIHDSIYFHDTVKIDVNPGKELNDFFASTDTLIFIKDIPAGNIPPYAVNKQLLIQAIKRLNKYTAGNPDSIIRYIQIIKSDFMFTNDGIGLKEKRQLSDEQKAFIKPILIRARDLYEDYLVTASSFNPALLSVEQLKKLQSLHKKPIQQAYLKTLEPTH